MSDPHRSLRRHYHLRAPSHPRNIHHQNLVAPLTNLSQSLKLNAYMSYLLHRDGAVTHSHWTETNTLPRPGAILDIATLCQVSLIRRSHLLTGTTLTCISRGRLSCVSHLWGGDEGRSDIFFNHIIRQPYLTLTSTCIYPRMPEGFTSHALPARYLFQYRCPDKQTDTAQEITSSPRCYHTFSSTRGSSSSIELPSAQGYRVA